MIEKASKLPRKETLRPPPSRRILGLLNSIRAGLAAVEGRPLAYEDLAQITGRPINTIADWFAGGSTHQLSALVCMLERLPPDIRHRIIDESCRVYPTIRHPRIAHDFHAIEALSSIIEKVAGLSIIQGQPEHVRTFVATALAHGCGRTSECNVVSGVDVHGITGFVPVLGVVYLETSTAVRVCRDAIERAWRNIREIGSRYILLNGVVSLVPELVPELLNMCKAVHVIIADQLSREAIRKLKDEHSADWITVSVARHNPAWIDLHILRS
jgi:hypothetical protein